MESSPNSYLFTGKQRNFSATAQTLNACGASSIPEVLDDAGRLTASGVYVSPRIADYT